MKSSIFEYSDYKKYLREALKARMEGKRGERSRLALFIGCHTAYVSQVLNGGAHFSLEQGERINRFFAHSKEQSLFFLFLIQSARAGTAALRAIFDEQIYSLKEKQFVLKDRLEFKKTLTREDQATFYSSWHYGAIHVLVSVPGCHTQRGLSDYLGIPIQRVTEVLQFLQGIGLVARDERGHFKVGTTHIHLEHNSPMISKHHTNWRLQAMQSLDQVSTRDLHYSSVITASRADADQIREILVGAIERIRAVVKDSRDEDGFCYTIDFFGLAKHG